MNGTSTEVTKAVKPRRSAKGTVQAAFFMGTWIAAVFCSAGRFDWLRGWICLFAYVVGVSIVGVMAHRYNPTLAEARANLHRKETKRFDKIILAIYYPVIYLQLVLAGLDAERYHWTSLPFWFVYIGVALFAVAMLLVGWVMSVNRFAESTVRIQTDRGHTVVSSGPYKYVRHPMYVGAILMYIATPLVLGSAWAFVFTLLTTALMVTRTALEDRTLRRELPGYEEFTKNTRYRLIPGIW